MGGIKSDVNQYDFFNDLNTNSNSNVSTNGAINISGNKLDAIEFEESTNKNLNSTNSSFELSSNQVNEPTINFSRISTNVNDALNGNFIKEESIHKEFWEGDLTFVKRDDGSIQILKDGVVMGYTDELGLNNSVELVVANENLLETNEEISVSLETKTESVVSETTPINEDVDKQIESKIPSETKTESVVSEITPINEDVDKQVESEIPSETKTEPVVSEIPPINDDVVVTNETSVIDTQKKEVSNVSYTKEELNTQINETLNKHNLTSEQLDTICAVVQQEAGHNPEEVKNVITTIVNRMESGKWGGTTPWEVVVADKQFQAYGAGHYKKYANHQYDESTEYIVASTLNGNMDTTHNWESFRSNGSTKYGGTILTPGGNRYK